MVEQPTELTEIGPLYAELMEEIKQRVDVILRVIESRVPLPKMVAFELCYLQLRKICEVFALACLCAHGDIPEVRGKLLQKAYDADQIIKRLTRLHPDFYPIPGTQVCDAVTGRPVRIERLASDFLTKSELLKMYGECGNYLHRGSVRQLLTNWEPAPNFKEIEEWVKKITILLNHHQIQTRRPDVQLWVLMRSRDDGKVKWAIMQRRDAQKRQVPLCQNPPVVLD